jgi:hypothetical protein
MKYINWKSSTFAILGVIGIFIMCQACQTLKPAGATQKEGDYTGMEKILIPHKSWPCGMAEGIPVPEQGVPMPVADMKLDQIYKLGKTPYGQRTVYVVKGGTITGKIEGKVLAAGADCQNLSNPAAIDARYLWQTNDGEVIIIRNAGGFGKLAPTFEVRENSKYAYLNSGLYLSSPPGMGEGGVSLTFYESVR